MVMQFTNTLAEQVTNDLFDRLNTACGGLANFVFYDGSQPGSTSDPDSGPEVVRLACSSPVFISLSGTTFVADTITNGTVTTAGTIQYFRVRDEFENVVFQGNCGTLGGEVIVFDNNIVGLGDDVALNTFDVAVQLEGS